MTGIQEELLLGFWQHQCMLCDRVQRKVPYGTESTSFYISKGRKIIRKMETGYPKGKFNNQQNNKWTQQLQQAPQRASTTTKEAAPDGLLLLLSLSLGHQLLVELSQHLGCVCYNNKKKSCLML
ncbi:uncharacterized protein LOC126469564 [Schistocerca serialis cubense]|uniref:uncharacterized protein LOC126469564 n=1 Tax=Schistocerca serialis cubense TaxID=2023355 RepID=UPI00214EB114|nr:uncharacterized protein LOC126469564 [Schistocerca serialis cubense]